MRDPGLGAQAKAVDHAGEPTAPAPDGAKRVDLELGGDPTPAVVGLDVEALAPGGRADEAGHAHLGARPGAARWAEPAVQAQHQPGAARRPVERARLHARAEGAGARNGEQVGTGMDRPARRQPSARGVDGGDPLTTPGRGDRDQHGGGHRRPRGAGKGQDRGGGAGNGHGNPRADGREHEPRGDGRQRDVAPVPLGEAAERRDPAAHGVRPSLSASSRFSPMPSTWRS